MQETDSYRVREQETRESGKPVRRKGFQQKMNIRPFAQTFANNLACRSNIRYVVAMPRNKIPPFLPNYSL
jgi:hypothetical protein